MKKILLIDNDPVDVFITESILNHIGFPHILHKSANGFEALQLLQQQSGEPAGLPELILIDLHMPMMDGFEFLEEFHRADLPGSEKVRLVVLTITHDVEGSRRAISLGAHGVLNKPLQLEQLRALM